SLNQERCCLAISRHGERAPLPFSTQKAIVAHVRQERSANLCACLPALTNCQRTVNGTIPAAYGRPASCYRRVRFSSCRSKTPRYVWRGCERHSLLPIGQAAYPFTLQAFIR